MFNMFPNNQIMDGNQSLIMQQNWSQWQAYQQQLAQWQAQYGEQYQREMLQKVNHSSAVYHPAGFAMAMTTVYPQTHSMPPLPLSQPPPPTTQLPAPPPIAHPVPPPPPPEPDNAKIEPSLNHEFQTTYPMHQQPPPPPSNPNSNAQPFESPRGPQPQNQFNLPSRDEQHKQNLCAVPLSVEEIAFDEQFKKWEDEFDNWKQLNVNHPDKVAYTEYETKMEQCRSKLLERREQMRQRKFQMMVPASTQQQQSIESTAFPSSNAGGDIPGLDLIEEEKPPKSLENEFGSTHDLTGNARDGDECTSTENNQNSNNLEAISKGINHILGDPALLNMLSFINQKGNGNTANQDMKEDDNAVAENYMGGNSNEDNYDNGNEGQYDEYNQFDGDNRGSFNFPGNRNNCQGNPNNSQRNNQSFQGNQFQMNDNQFQGNNQFQENQSFHRNQFQGNGGFQGNNMFQGNNHPFQGNNNMQRNQNQFFGNHTQFQGRNNQFRGNNNPMQGNGNQFQGNGNQFQGKGNQFQGNGNQFQGNGNQFQDNGNQFQGNGNQFQGNGIQFQRYGNQFQGNNNQFQGNNRFQNNNNQFQGNNQFSDNEGYDGNNQFTDDEQYNNDDFDGNVDPFPNDDDGEQEQPFDDGPNMQQCNTKTNDLTPHFRQNAGPDRRPNGSPIDNDPISLSERRPVDEPAFDNRHRPTNLPTTEPDNRTIESDAVFKVRQVINYDNSSLPRNEPIVGVAKKVFDYGHCSNANFFKPKQSIEYGHMSYRPNAKRSMPPFSRQAFVRQHPAKKQKIAPVPHHNEQPIFDTEVQPEPTPQPPPPQLKRGSTRVTLTQIDTNAAPPNRSNNTEVLMTDHPPTSNIVKVEDILYEPGRKTRPQKILILMRGPPGSGKSYLAKKLKEAEHNQFKTSVRILSIDDYFTSDIEDAEADSSTGTTDTAKSSNYKYNQEKEKSYAGYLMKLAKKTFADGLFEFIIVDAVNASLAYCSEMCNSAKQQGFTPYTCELLPSTAKCFERNIHGRTLADIEEIVRTWQTVPQSYLKLNVDDFVEASSD